MKKKLHKRVIIATSLPYTRERFIQMFRSGNSDFIHSLARSYRVSTEEELWIKYAPLAGRICAAFKEYMSLGAVVIDNLQSSDLLRIVDADAVIFMIHHADYADELELSDGMIATHKFISLLPQAFSGVVDLSSCFSSNIQLSVKMHCPNCKVLAVKTKTSIDLRLAIYSNVINIMSRKKALSYIDAIQKTLDVMYKSHMCSSDLKRETVYLGGETVSSVYAPREVCKGNSFIVQIVLHKTNEIEQVEIFAREIDDSAVLRNPIRLKFKLRKNDRIDFVLNVESVSDGDFNIKQKRKTIVWSNELTFVQFLVGVSKFCESSYCIADIKVCVNKSIVGNIVFKTKISKIDSLFPAKITFEQYDRSEEMSNAKICLLNALTREKSLLENAITVESAEDNMAQLQRNLEICQNSIRLLTEREHKSNPIQKVFISSTSDLYKYRQIVREQVEHCAMYPEMYENWSQRGTYPRDYCCEKVLSSDIFVCILGAKYGFVEPMMDISMTEIEYRVALQSGKPILVYIVKDYERLMVEQNIQHEESSKKQCKLIKEMETTRMVDYFNDEMSLALAARGDLKPFQHNS